MMTINTSYNLLHSNTITQKMESTPETGLVPDVFAEDDKKVKRGDIEETLLKTALEYIENNPLDNN